jgi:glycopeptide antibiotics resistance protein
VFQIQPQPEYHFVKRSSKPKKRMTLKEGLIICLFIYLLLVIYVTLFAWNYGASLGPVGPGGRNYNFIPFRSIYRIAVYSPTIVAPIKILIGNIILFVPFGFLVPIAFKSFRTTVMGTTFFGMLFSILIESSQYLFTYRVSNIDDVILNTLGAFIGAVMIRICFFIRSKIWYFKT